MTAAAQPVAAVPPRVIAVVRVGTFTLALDAALVQRVIMGPVHLSPLPRNAPYALGAFSWLGSAITVVDIAAVLAPDGASIVHPAVEQRPVAQVLLLQQAGTRFAIQVDAVLGITRVAAGTITDVESRPGQTAALYSQLYTPPDGGSVAVILDIDAVLALGDLRTTVNPIGNGPTADSGHHQHGESHVLVRAGGRCLAIPTRTVRQVQRTPAHTGFAMPHESLRGFHEFRSETLAIIDLASLLGSTGEPAGSAGSHLVVVGQDSHDSLSLLIDDVLAIVPIAPERITPLADGASAHMALCSGSLLVPQHGIALVVDPAALLRAASIVDRTLFTRAEPGTDAGAMTAAHTAITAERTRYMVYAAGGGILASPVRQLSAVIGLPDAFTDLRQRGESLAGICVHGARTVPVYDLATLMGRTPLADLAKRPVLIVEGADGPRGYAVEHLAFLHDAYPSPLPRLSQVQMGALPTMREMFRATRDGVALSATVLDLAALVARTAGAPDLRVHAA